MTRRNPQLLSLIMKYSKNRIKILAAERDINITDLAAAIGKSAHALRRYTRQEAQPRIELADQLAEFFGCTRAEVLGESAQTAAAAARRETPLYGAAQGAAGYGFNDFSAPIDMIAAPDFVLDQAYAVLVAGDSMEPRFCAGETLYVQPGLPLRRGDDCVIQIKRCGVTQALVKRFATAGDHVVVRELNPANEITFDSADVFAVHKIVGLKIT